VTGVLSMSSVATPTLAYGCEGVLVDAADAFQYAHREGVLRAAVAGTLAFTLAMGFLLTLAGFQRDGGASVRPPPSCATLAWRATRRFFMVPGRVAARRYARRRAK
jgi:hypothetical protein